MDVGYLKIDGEEIAYNRRGGARLNEYLVIMHGAGQGSMERYAQIATEVADAGPTVITFDFSGHGRSTGELSELSLQRRTTQALGVITSLCSGAELLTLAGFSMSGQTVCDLLSMSDLQVKAVFLFCPAAYRPEVYSLPFGNSEFTRLIREPGTWKTSTAFLALEEFPGAITLVIPDEDNVIPAAVTEQFLVSARKPILVSLTGCPHKIAGWLAATPQARKDIVSMLANG